MFTLNKKSIIGCAALLMALAACSDNEDKPLSVMGGATEETDSLANADTSTTDNQDTSSTDNQDTSSIDNQDTTQNSAKNNKTFYFRQASLDLSFFENSRVSMSSNQLFDMAIMYELDTNKLIPTGNAILSLNVNQNGRYSNYQIQFDSISFKNPYVIIELGYKNAYKGIKTRRAIVDLRDTGNIYINTLTNIISYRIEYASLEGSTFAEIKSNAERELLHALGIYETFSNFEKESSFNDSNLVFIENALSQLLRKDEEDALFTSFNDEGKFEYAGNFILDTLLKYTTNIDKIHFELIDRAGNPWLEDYYKAQKLNQFYINLMAAMHNAGPCTNEREGEWHPLTKKNLHLLCGSGAWKVKIKPIPHSIDSIVDPRDGNVYKTVTIDMNGSSQTWMAENLVYAAEASTCSQAIITPYMDDPFYCKFYGREYSLPTALGIDSSFYRPPNFNDCVQYNKTYCRSSCTDSLFHVQDSLLNVQDSIDFDFYESLDKCSFECSIVTDTAAFLSACESEHRKIDWDKVKNVTDPRKMQGICPDGWRIPSTEDWNKWIDLFKKNYDLTEPANDNDVNLFFFSTYGDPSGFGIRHEGFPNPNYKDYEDGSYMKKTFRDAYFSKDPYLSFTAWPTQTRDEMSSVWSISEDKMIPAYSFDISWPGIFLAVEGIPEESNHFYIRCIKNN